MNWEGVYVKAVITNIRYGKDKVDDWVIRPIMQVDEEK